MEAARRWAPDGIAVNALTPGRIRTGLPRYVPELADVPGVRRGVAAYAVDPEAAARLWALSTP